MAVDYKQLSERLNNTLSKPIFFIVGCQKSGTTWVQRLLDGHPEICCKGEGCFGTILIPALQQALANYNTKQKVGEEGGFTDEHLRFLLTTAMGLLFDRWQDQRGEQAKCVGEKTPEHAVYLPMLDQLLGPIKVIHIIRDGRDGAVSGWFHNQRKPSPQFKQRFGDMASYVRYFAKSHWLPYIQYARAFGQQNPERYHELRYETLHENPEPHIRAMLEFLEVTPDDEMVQACQQAGSFKTLSQGRQPGQEDRQSFFRKGIIGDWKEHLDQASIAAFQEEAGTLLGELGYDTP